MISEKQAREWLHKYYDGMTTTNHFILIGKELNLIEEQKEDEWVLANEAVEKLKETMFKQAKSKCYNKKCRFYSKEQKDCGMYIDFDKTKDCKDYKPKKLKKKKYQK